MATCETKPGESKNIQGIKVPSLTSWRYVMAYIGFVGFLFIYAMRFNFSIAIMCMVENNVTDKYDNVTENHREHENVTRHQKFPTFDWSRQLQGYILSSFFYGYLLTQLPSGYLADRYGGKIVFFVGMMVSGVAMILIPAGAGGHYAIVMVLRFFIGLGTGVVFPCMHSMWAKWAPLFERTKLVAFTYSGTMIGNVSAYFISGLLCDSILGWPSIFYFTGGLTVVWCGFWWFGVYNCPDDHPYVSATEKKYIELHIASENNHQGKLPIKVPWKHILTSLPVMAIVVAHTSMGWMGYTMFTCLPMYMSDVLNFDVKSNGIYSSLPYIISFVTLNITSVTVDWLRKKGVRTVLLRKALQTFSGIIMAATMVAIGYLDASQAFLAMIFLVINAIASSLTRSGYVVNHIDIAPRYAGVLYGLTNTAATVTGILTPIVVGQLTPGKTREEWQVVFLICAAVVIAGNIFYVIFAAGDEQLWARIGTVWPTDSDIIHPLNTVNTYTRQTQQQTNV